MSVLHLGSDSEKPINVDNQIRLYNMRFCPFSHRIRLILSYKKIPHNIININIKDTPQWYYEINPKGQVPTLVGLDSKVIVDSLNIANYLNEKYPDPPLYDESTKERDLALLDHFGKIINIFSNCIHHKDDRPLQESIDEMFDLLMELEDELKLRGTKFFGGENPNMLDILIWPWVERAKALPLIYKESLNFDKTKIVHIMDWIGEMKCQPFVEENNDSFQNFACHIEMMKAGCKNLDNI